MNSSSILFQSSLILYAIDCTPLHILLQSNLMQTASIHFTPLQFSVTQSLPLHFILLYFSPSNSVQFCERHFISFCCSPIHFTLLESTPFFFTLVQFNSLHRSSSTSLHRSNRFSSPCSRLYWMSFSFYFFLAQSIHFTSLNCNSSQCTLIHFSAVHFNLSLPTFPLLLFFLFFSSPSI